MKFSVQALKAQAERLASLDANLTFRISRVAKLLETDGSQRLGAHPINLVSYRMMLTIDIFEEISVSDLSQVTLIDRAQISRTASELIERGLLVARSDVQSKRKKILALTAEGRGVFAAAASEFRARQAEIEARIGPEGVDAFRHAIDAIADYIEEKDRA